MAKRENNEKRNKEVKTDERMILFHEVSQQQ